MSSLPGLTLEDFVAWNYRITVGGDGSNNISLSLAEALGNIRARPDVSVNDFSKMIEKFEPWREYVENGLANFDEETQSWRDYAGAAFDGIPDEIFDQGLQLLDSF